MKTSRIAILATSLGFICFFSNLCGATSNASTTQQALERAEVYVTNQNTKNLLEKARGLQAKGQKSESLKILNAIANYYKKGLAAEGEHSVDYLFGVAELYESQGELKKALQLYQLVRKNLERALGQKNPFEAMLTEKIGRLLGLKDKDGKNINTKIDSLNELWNKVEIAHQEKRYTIELKFLEKILTRTKQESGPKSTDAAVVMTIIGTSYQLYNRNDEQALKYLKEALEIKKKNLGLNNENTLITLNSLVQALCNLGKTEEANEMAEKALLMYRAKEREKDRFYSSILGSLEGVYLRNGNIKKAFEIMNEKKEVDVLLYGPSSKQTAMNGLKIGTILSESGETSKAETEYLQSIEILKLMNDPESKADLAIARQNLASIYSETGELRKAQELYALACPAINDHYRKTKYAPIPLLLCLNNQALTDYKLGKTQEAKDELAKLLTRIGKLNLRDSRAYVETISNLATIEVETGQPKTAIGLSRMGLKQIEKFNMSQGSDAAKLLNIIAISLKSQNDFKGAEENYKEAIRITGKNSTPGSPVITTFEVNLAANYLQRRDYSKAEAVLAKSLKDLFFWYEKEALGYDESRASKLKDTTGSPWMLAYSLLYSNPKSLNLAYYARINAQGLISSIQRERTMVSTYNKVANKQAPSLIKSSDEVFQAIPKNSVLIEFQKFYPYKPVKSSSNQWDFDSKDPHYVAFVTENDRKLLAIQLGSAKQIDDQINIATEALRTKASDSLEVLSKLESMIFTRIKPHIKNKENVFIAPDSSLYKVPFGSMQLFRGSGINAITVTSGRDLISENKRDRQLEAPVVIANPQFGEPAVTDQGQLYSARGEAQVLNNTPTHWASLKGSEVEGLQVAKVLRVSLISGKEATSTKVKALHSPIILHIASHAFLPREKPKTKYEPGVRVLHETSGAVSIEGDVSRAGIVLAGANYNSHETLNPGILTAEEISKIDLTGTELVVLSGCETGLGNVRIGEGLYGLQRALRIAGAKSSLLSLWKVDDAATAEFMFRFYKRLKAGEGKANALTATQKEFRDGQVRDPQTKLAWSSPYYWAAWQLVGDWRPIKGL